MEFKDRLSAYMDELNITVHELAQACSVSDAVISRYKNGSRIPDYSDRILENISRVILNAYNNSETSETNNRSYEEIFTSLSSLLPNANINKDAFRIKLNRLVETLDISLSSFAKSANYDPSFISRVCAGKRFPSDYDSFAETVADYVAVLCRSKSAFNLLNTSGLISVSSDGDISISGNSINHGQIKDAVKNYLLSDEPTVKTRSSEDIYTFINKINDFNLEDYVRAIHFDKLKIPTVPVHFPTTKNYFGLEGMKSIELDFLKAAAFEPSGSNIYMYSSIPIEDMIKDASFSKKWMIGLAAILKKGHILHMIHDLNRPYHEMMAGLQNWIPLYMTGQIVPYYLDNDNDKNYSHMIRVSETAATYGDCSCDDIKTASLYMTRNKNEMALFRMRKDMLFKRALPLMNIYTPKTLDAFYDFFKKTITANDANDIVCLLDAPPLHTLSDDLFHRIAKYNNLAEQTTDILSRYISLHTQILDSVTGNGSSLRDSFPILSKDEFEAHPVSFYISGISLTYSYEMYLEHIDSTKNKEKRTDGYSTNENNLYPFRNIQLLILNHKLAIVSKNTAPAIHFVIHHPLLVNAISKLMPIIFEPED